MVDEFETTGDRRRRSDRRSGTNRRSGKDRRNTADRRTTPDRRSDKDRREGWGQIEGQRLQGALTAAATVAHLFSQPLTIIIGHVDLLLSNAEEEKTKKKLMIIKEQLKTLSMTLQDLRNLREYNTIEFDGLKLLDMDLRKAGKRD
jgi:signal transduction histidine kinase